MWNKHQSESRYYDSITHHQKPAFSKSRLAPKKLSHFQKAGTGFLAPKIAK
jgi:hypothetical protein